MFTVDDTKGAAMISKTLKFAAIGLAGLVATATLVACGATSVTTPYQAQCGGKTLQFQKVTKHKFDTIQDTPQIVFGDKAPIKMVQDEISGLPHDAAVYGKAPFHRLDDKQQTYPHGTYVLKKSLVVIYVDPANYSRTEFDALHVCLQAHAAAITKAIGADKDFQPSQLAGMVYGRETDFVEVFEKNAKDFYEVHPDGVVTHVEHDADGIKGMKSYSGGGLSNITPSGEILITDTKETSLAALQKYQDARGQSLPQRFTVKVETKRPDAAPSN